MDIRVASILLLLVALTAAHGERYVVKKVMKAPQYQPYSVKSHGMFQKNASLCFLQRAEDLLLSLVLDLNKAKQILGKNIRYAHE